MRAHLAEPDDPGRLGLPIHALPELGVTRHLEESVVMRLTVSAGS
jgi:hypothetical protein